MKVQYTDESIQRSMQELKWGNWTFDPGTLVLTHDETRYEVALDECTTSAKTLDWIMQVAGKTWVSEHDLGHLVRAINSLLRPQATLCSMGVDGGPIQPEKVIERQRQIHDAMRATAAE